MAITNGYCTLAELKDALGIADSVDDTELELAIETASRDIDSFTGRNFYNNGTATRVFAAVDNFTLLIDDLISVTSLKTSSNLDNQFDITWTASDYQLEPLNGRSGGISGWPFTRIRAVNTLLFPQYMARALVQIEGVWGWTAVPKPIKTATLLQAARLFKRKDAPFGVAGFGDIGVVRITRALDPDVAQSINDYILQRGIG